jgi:TonB family protein
MRFIRILVIGSLCVGSVPALTAGQSKAGVEIRQAPGPLEQQAKMVKVANELPHRKTTENAEYPWELRKIGARAALIVQITVNDSGRVVEIRRVQGPLMQKAIGSPEDLAAERVASAAVLRSTVAAVNDWRFDKPAAGSFTFQESFGFAGGQVTSRMADPTEVLPTQVAEAPWAAAEGAMRTGAIKPPKKTKYVKPVYPKAALEARVQGSVVLEIVIGIDGHVRDARILKSVPQLDQAAIEATLKAEYEPVQVYGNPVAVIQTVTHDFSFKTRTE